MNILFGDDLFRQYFQAQGNPLSGLGGSMECSLIRILVAANCVTLSFYSPNLARRCILALSFRARFKAAAFQSGVRAGLDPFLN